MKLTRRQFLALGLGSGIMVIYGASSWSFLNPTRVIVAILKRRIGYLQVDPHTFETFAQDYIRDRLAVEQRYLSYFSIVSIPYQYLTPYDWLRPGHAFRRLEDNVVSRYLLSTDFFQHGGNELRSVNYLSFYDPYNTACRNPFTRPPE